MFCPNCGNRIKSNANFCKECGWARTEAQASKNSKFNIPIISIIAITVGIIILIVVGVVSNTNISSNNSKELKEIYKTGIETTATGKIVYNKGNDVYARNEIIKDGSDLYFLIVMKIW